MKKSFCIALFLFVFTIVDTNFLTACSSFEATIPPIKNTPENEEEKIENTYRNPLLSRGADPWVMKHEDTYYYTHTTGNSLELRWTKNMENLNSTLSLKIWSPPTGTIYSEQIWAPEIHFIDNKWYMYFAATYSDGSEGAQMQIGGCLSWKIPPRVH